MHCIGAAAGRNSKDRLRRISSRNEENAMMDMLMLALGFVFFALAIGYTYACERL
jgi:preprotein translocase subunit SecG